jgi:hypothetical protein
VFIVILTIIVIYYNAFLARRNKPPFQVWGFLPQILFPRGIEGIGRHNLEEENMSREEYRNLLSGPAY